MGMNRVCSRADRQCSRTLGVSRASGSASKNWLGVKAMDPAISTAGNVAIVVLYSRTATL